MSKDTIYLPLSLGNFLEGRTLKDRNIGQVIATRKYHLVGDEKTILLVKIGMPVPSDDGVDFYCPYEIVAGRTESVEFAAGVDAIQALQLAVMAIASKVKLHNDRRGGRLRWLSDENTDLGFPDVVEALRRDQEGG